MTSVKQILKTRLKDFEHKLESLKIKRDSVLESMSILSFETDEMDGSEEYDLRYSYEILEKELVNIDNTLAKYIHELFGGILRAQDVEQFVIEFLPKH